MAGTLQRQWCYKSCKTYPKSVLKVHSLNLCPSGAIAFLLHCNRCGKGLAYRFAVRNQVRSRSGSREALFCVPIHWQLISNGRKPRELQ